MAVQSDTSRIQYAGNNSTTTSYAVPFVFQENAHLKAIARTSAGVESVVTLTNHTGVGNVNGGTVRTAVAVPATSTLTIYREVPATQTTTYAEGGDFPAASHERALDKLTQIAQQLDRKVGSAIRLSAATQLPDLNPPLTNQQHILSSVGGAAPSWQALPSLSIGPVIATGSTTARSVQDRAADVVNVKDFGAVGNGVADDTAAIQAAAQSVATGGIVYFPKGTYLCGGLTLSNLFAVTFQGANKFTSVLMLTQTGTLLSLPNAQWCRLEKLGFQTNAAPHSIASAYGVSFSASAGNNVVEDCLFSGFSKNGLRIEGTVGSQLSGHKVLHSMFLGNAEEQLFAKYCNDFHMESNQFGRLSGITVATVGCYLDNSSAGTYSRNYHWDNTVGFKAETCDYNTYSDNRFEESSEQNVIINSGSYHLFCNNKVHTASKGSSGTHDNILVTGAAYFSATGNSLFQWSGNSRWGININTGCSEVTLGKNQIQGFSNSFGPVRVDGSVAAISGDFELRGLTSTQSASGQTTYIGSQVNTFEEGAAMFPVPRRCQPLRIYAAADAAPSSGQSYTYTMRVNGADTSCAAQASGSAFAAAANTGAPSVLVPKDASVSVKLTTSASAAAGRHRFYISFVEY